MERFIKHLPLLITLSAIAALLVHGPIPQFDNYHDFADQSPLLGIPNGLDVLSNVGFAMVAVWGFVRLWPQRRSPALANAWPGIALLLFALIGTAAGSSVYHLAPDNLVLVWDRLPIALACAGLLAAVPASLRPEANGATRTWLLAVAAIASVGWWGFTEHNGVGDLRPYLLIQLLPLVLIPIWQAAYQAPRDERLLFALAIGLYVMAKFAELGDHAILEATGWISGHTLKHILATGAAAVIVGVFVRRAQHAGAADRNDAREPLDWRNATRARG